MKTVYTTGEVAKICNVTIRTVIKWFESGELEGFKIPNSRDRRIPRERLVEFMRKHKIPLNRLDMGNRKRLLIADDEEGILFVLEKCFREVGIFDIETAGSGLETGIKLTSFLPHVLILDHLLGDTTSKEVMRIIRENPILEDLKILVMSGYLSDEEVEKMKKDGMQDFIRKPFDLNEVKAKVFKLLEMA